jgi:hypothetical protein
LIRMRRQRTRQLRIWMPKNKGGEPYPPERLGSR